MTDYTLQYSDYWEKLIDNKTGEVVIEGHHLDATDILNLFGYTYNTEEYFEEEEE